MGFALFLTWKGYVRIRLVVVGLLNFTQGLTPKASGWSVVEWIATEKKPRATRKRTREKAFSVVFLIGFPATILAPFVVEAPNHRTVPARLSIGMGSNQ